MKIKKLQLFDKKFVIFALLCTIGNVLYIVIEQLNVAKEFLPS